MRTAILVAGAAVLALGGCTVPHEEAHSTISPVSPSGGPVPASTPPGPDLALRVGRLVAQGSVGTVPATVKITIVNNGSSAGPFYLTFYGMPQSVAIDGAFPAGCQRTDSGSDWRMTCRADGLAPGASRDYTFAFTVDVGQPRPLYGQVMVIGVGTETNLADNLGTLQLCTNGC